MPDFATMPDIIAPNLRVLFCGINPSLYSVKAGHHFARPGNRFWRALHESGFTPRRFLPTDDDELLACGLGITNVAPRATVAAADLSRSELKNGGLALREKVRHFAPQTLAILGIGAYRVAFAKPEARIGAQEEMIGDTRVWVLPNPSGLNAHYPPTQLAQCFAALRRSVEPI
jgi:TDG/mug DNA glycosylase family protein